MALAFHATSPPGEWINDPNALFFADGEYQLLVQYSRSSPDFKEVGWGRLSSSDLVNWRWHGSALPPGPEGSVYSGSVAFAEGRWEAFYTRHDPAGPWQTQRRAISGSGPTDWNEVPGAIGPAGRNMRDPFVFRSAATDDWRMLVSNPCDWNDWQADQPSRIEVWRSPDRAKWEPAGTIGPWAPAGVLWEVPVLLELDGAHLLIVSTVDRRGGGARCSVRYWPGRWLGTDFQPDPRIPAEGLAIDLGPDFYAAIPNAVEDWPSADRLLVGWAASWDTARQAAWPGAAGGGPISLPRKLDFECRTGRLRQRPLGGAEAHSRWAQTLAGHLPFRLSIAGGGSELTIEGDPAGGDIHVERRAPPPFRWSAHHRGTLEPATRRNFEVFVDGPLVELFISPEGLTLTAMLPHAQDVEINLRRGDE